MSSDCLIEVGTEELPPRALQPLARDFSALLERILAGHDLAPASIEVFATPRRLAMLLRGTPTQQPRQEIEKRGPAFDAAFDGDGKPTRAALGFAASCGVEVDSLERRETDRGSWLYYKSSAAGKRLTDVLPEALQQALGELPIPKRMRWGERSDEFVRPVRWLVLMIGDEVVDAEIFGVASGRHTRGHRFHAPRAIEIPSATEYSQLLASQGWVIASFDARRARIRELIEQEAARLGGEARIEDALLDEVTALVEYPVAVCGRFDAEFLALPPEVLVTTMQDNQKYFALFDRDGALMPHFIAIANIESRQPELVASGNERVIRPRFADAEFFYNQDRRRGLDPMRVDLDEVVFQEKLGSLGDRTRRIIRLARYIASHTGADQDLVHRAADLCKADLMSDMVGEFPKLQGVMGKYYARLQEEAEPVCNAIEQHYWPRYAGDHLPEDDVAQAVALAERLDSLVGIFAIGEKPGGDKDPFALRRAALGVLRIIVENRLELDLGDLCQTAADGYPGISKPARRSARWSSTSSIGCAAITRSRVSATISSMPSPVADPPRFTIAICASARCSGSRVTMPRSRWPPPTSAPVISSRNSNPGEERSIRRYFNRTRSGNCSSNSGGNAMRRLPNSRRGTTCPGSSDWPNCVPPSTCFSTRSWSWTRTRRLKTTGLHYSTNCCKVSG